VRYRRNLYSRETKIMVKCPNCRREVAKHDKKWKYGKFCVDVFTCKNCNTKFREYTKNGKHSFTLMLKKGKGYVRA
jgi:transposase-like protein